MSNLAQKIKENHGKVASHKAPGRQNTNNTAFGFTDNRPESIAQRKLQRIMNSTPGFQLNPFQETQTGIGQKNTLNLRGIVNHRALNITQKKQKVSSHINTAESLQFKETGTHANQTVLQRVTLALGELQEAANAKKKLTQKEHEHAKIITDGEEGYRSKTGEKQVHPWDERFRPFKSGALSGIGSENLRIYGHGASYVGEGVVAMVGGYTPKNLASKLIKLGLPNKYSGEIYLTGCETAIGPKRGFLGEFYKLISAHCASVTVRGNLGITTTREDGRQGVWTGAIDKGRYDKTRNALNEKKEHYLGKNAQLIKKIPALTQTDKALIKENQELSSANASKAKLQEFNTKKQKHEKACEALSEASQEINKFMKLVTKGIKEIDDIAYDTSGRLSVTLPASFGEDGRAQAAIAEAQAAEKLRLTKLEIAEELASMYGWAESVVTEKVHGGELDHRAKARIKSQSEPTPSYIG